MRAADSADRAVPGSDSLLGSAQLQADYAWDVAADRWRGRRRIRRGRRGWRRRLYRWWRRRWRRNLLGRAEHATPGRSGITVVVDVGRKRPDVPAGRDQAAAYVDPGVALVPRLEGPARRAAGPTVSAFRSCASSPCGVQGSPPETCSTCTLRTGSTSSPSSPIVLTFLVVSNIGLLAVLLAAKMVPKLAFVYPLARRADRRHGTFTTLLTSRGLTFGTISSLYGPNAGIIDKTQFSLLVTVRRARSTSSGSGTCRPPRCRSAGCSGRLPAHVDEDHVGRRARVAVVVIAARIHVALDRLEAPCRA
jgi:hypothetical protein